MAQPHVGEIRMFAGNFAPAGWMFCEGQLLPISENDTLFQLIGTTYGGDGQETFKLPDLRGRIPIHYGNASSGTIYELADKGGVESVTLTDQQIPSHSHSVLATTDLANSASPADGYLSTTATGNKIYSTANPTIALSAQEISPIGGSQPHDNFQPYLCVNFIIALFGLFPSQS